MPRTENKNVIMDGRILRRLAKEFLFKYDKKHYYVFDDPLRKQAMREAGYKLEYFDDCFYPFVVKVSQPITKK
jgi:hypothetical protein